MTKVGMNVTIAGTISVNTVIPSTTRDAVVLQRASAYPAIREMTTVAAVWTVATISEVASAGRIPRLGLPSTWASVPPPTASGHQRHAGATTACWVENAFLAIT